MNNYTGWDCTTADGIARRTLDASLTPEVFFKEYVQPRRPVLLVRPKDSTEGLIRIGSAASVSKTTFGASFAKWTPAYLRSICPDAPVRVEQRSPTPGPSLQTGKFGQGMRTTMAFGEFVDRSESGGTNLYLTSQACQAYANAQDGVLFMPSVLLLVLKWSLDLALSRT